ncbi:MAG: MFS transporter, partial [Anaerolineaceae bacterium]|nr:MFS transporter [Anaerolineaceae bacterium]
MLKHPLVRTLFNLRGNQKSAVLTEPLWGIPFNLYAPYVSVYMLALGLKDVQIGLILSINLAVQLVSALLSGPITDKLGRRMTTMIFDFISWTIPAAIWAIAQDFRYFVVAALFNGVWRVTHTSWSCMV